MRPKRLFPPVLALLATAILLGGAAPSPARAMDLPPDAAGLLPADAAVVVVLRSLADAERAWPQGGGEADDPKGLRAKAWRGPGSWLAEAAPDLMHHVDPLRPAALAMTIAPPMSGKPMRLVAILPLVEKARDPYFLERLGGDVRVLLRGGYGAVCSDPEWEPGDTPPPLAAGLPDGAIVARADLKGIIANMRPMVEMGLGMMAAGLGEAAPDSTGTPALPRPGPEQVAAMQDFARALMDALVRLDLTLDRGPSGHRLDGVLEAAPGSMLDWGPQPDFGRALSVSGLIPPGMPMVQAAAVDMTPLLDRLAPFYGALQSMSLASAGGQTAFGGQARGLLDLMRNWQNPFAVGFAMGRQGMRLHSAYAMADPGAALDATIARYRDLTGPGSPMSFEEGPAEETDGVPVRTFTLKFTPPEADPAAADTAGSLPAVFELLRTFYPPVRAAAMPGLALMVMDQDPTAMREMIARVRASAGAPHPYLATLAARFGPDTRAVVAGDIAALISDVFALIAQLGESGPVPALAPVEFSLVSGLRGLEHRFWAEMDLEKLAAAFKALEAAFPDQEEEAEPESAPGKAPRRPARDVTR